MLDLTDDELSQKTGLTKDQLDMARAFLGLPPGWVQTKTRVGRGATGSTSTRFTPGDKVEEWLVRIKSLKLQYQEQAPVSTDSLRNPE